MADSKIITGQYVEVSQTPASVGDRLVAAFLDWIFINVYFTVVYGAFFGSSVADKIASDYVIVIFIILLIPPAFYFPLCELFMNGQSIGKRIMGIRVAMADGSTPSLGGYLLRWILYPIDTFATMGLGLVFILFSKNAQRLGDLAAGTMVVKTRNYLYSFNAMGNYNFFHAGYKPTYSEASNLSPKQAGIISRTLYCPDPNKRDMLIYRLAGQVQEFMAVNVPHNLPADVFLTTALNDYYYYASTLDD